MFSRSYYDYGSDRLETIAVRALHKIVKVHLSQQENAGAVQETVVLHVTELLQIF